MFRKEESSRKKVKTKKKGMAYTWESPTSFFIELENIISSHDKKEGSFYFIFININLQRVLH